MEPINIPEICLRLERVISNTLKFWETESGSWLPNLKAGEWRERRAKGGGRFLMYILKHIFNICLPCSLQLFPYASVWMMKEIGTHRKLWIRSLGSITWKQHQKRLSRKEITAGCPRGTDEHSRGYQELSCSKTSLCDAHRWRKKLNKVE